MNATELVTAAIQKLDNHSTKHATLVGFDGFVDEILHLVDKRQSTTSFSRIETITALSERLAGAAGKSCNIELSVFQTKLGGNGPIMANALISQNSEVTYCGSIGEHNIHPVFADFAKQCQQVVSIVDPGHTDAMEFLDGKVLFGKTESLNDITYDNLLARFGHDQFKTVIEKVDLIAGVNWTMIPYLNTIYRGLIEILAEIDSRKTIFIDLTDPRKRTDTDIAEVLTILTKMNQNSDVILGLNELEAQQVESVLGISTSNDFIQSTHAIREKLKLHIVIIHTVDSAFVSSTDGSEQIAGPYTETPKLTTGAGDNFNAGFVTGYLAGLTPGECLVTGVCSSGFYVRNCRSASKTEITAFAQQWLDADFKLP